MVEPPVESFVGCGPPRFYLPVDPEGFNPAFAQLIVNTNSPEDLYATLHGIREPKTQT